MRLSDVATIKTNFPEAHFWLVRRGSAKACGQPTREFNPEHIGVRVERIDLLLPDYLYYVFHYIHSTGQWEPKATGSLSLVNIRVSDVKQITLVPQ
ncbi:hypothetical protein [Spartinivicinus ruber]|uniref:hypothetical protein n=1 Tax=Spartinivicinus ruber TaxID=2683272 RepID=UPI0013D317E4|nr:hypothetical protein [Spartinivicinus ruber]